MPRPRTVSDSVEVAASASVVYDLVSDPAAMPRWSPENVGATVRATDGRPNGRGLPVGTVFVGRNRRGSMAWSTECVVIAADPDRRFAFRVRRWGVGTPRLTLGIATWEYRLDALPGGGTRVTETWTDERRWPDWLAAGFDRVVTGTSFAVHQHRNLAGSLRRLQELVDAGPAADGARGPSGGHGTRQRSRR